MGGLRPDDLPVVATGEQEEALPRGWVAVIRCVQHLPLDPIGQGTEGLDEGAEGLSLLGLDRSPIDSQGPVVLEFAHVFDTDRVDVEALRPPDDMPSRGAGLVIHRPAASGNGVVRAFWRSPHEVDATPRNDLLRVDIVDGRAQVRGLRMVRAMRRNGLIPVVNTDQLVVQTEFLACLGDSRRGPAGTAEEVHNDKGFLGGLFGR